MDNIEQNFGEITFDSLRHANAIQCALLNLLKEIGIAQVRRGERLSYVCGFGNGWDDLWAMPDDLSIPSPYWMNGRFGPYHTPQMKIDRPLVDAISGNINHARKLALLINVKGIGDDLNNRLARHG